MIAKYICLEEDAAAVLVSCCTIRLHTLVASLGRNNCLLVNILCSNLPHDVCQHTGSASQPLAPAVSGTFPLLVRRLELLDAAVKAREDAASFDSSRLVEFSERLVWEGPAMQLSPLVREPGRLAVTDQRVYFQPLHNIAGTIRQLQSWEATSMLQSQSTRAATCVLVSAAWTCTCHELVSPDLGPCSLLASALNKCIVCMCVDSIVLSS